MIKKITSVLCMLIALNLSAQQFVHQVFILNEGYYDWSAGQQVVPVSVGVYNPGTGSYSEVATINNARFGSDILATDDAFYVAADSFLLKYDKDSYQLLSQEIVVGIREFAEWNGQLVITRGETGGLPHYAEVRNANDLSLQYAIMPSDGLQWSCEGVAVENGIAYLAVNNAFDWGNLVGKVGRIDLASGAYLGDIDLGANGVNPENIMFSNGKLYTLNNKDFSGSSISEVSLASASLSLTQDISVTSGCGASVMADDKVYFQEYDLALVSRYDPANASIIDTLTGTASYYGMEANEIDQLLYTTTTDFVSTGDFHVVDFNGNVISSIPAGVSAGNLSLDVRMTTNIAELSNEPLHILREGNQIHLPTNEPVQLFTSTGKLLYSGAPTGVNNSLNIDAYSSAMLLVQQGGKMAKVIR